MTQEWPRLLKWKGYIYQIGEHLYMKWGFSLQILVNISEMSILVYLKTRDVVQLVVCLHRGILSSVPRAEWYGLDVVVHVCDPSIQFWGEGRRSGIQGLSQLVLVRCQNNLFCLPVSVPLGKTLNPVYWYENVSFCFILGLHFYYRWANEFSA